MWAQENNPKFPGSNNLRYAVYGDAVSSTSDITSDMIDNTTTGHNTVLSNNVAPEGCIEVRFDEMDFLPWNNPDNIVSAEVEATTVRVKDSLLPLLFLIGAPGNIINMAVFYKQGLKDRVNLCLFALSFADGIFLTQAMFFHGEQAYRQFISAEKYGPMMTFMTNHNLVVLFGFQWVSQILSAIIATERCLCISNPLKFQALLQTRTMAVIILAVYLLVLGLFFIVSFRYRVGCVYNPATGDVSEELVVGEFYQAHIELVTYLDNFVYGAGIPGTSIIIVVTTTIITAVKLRQIMTWRAGTSSSVSDREVALTKMLIGSSLLFIACITPTGLFRVVCIFFPDFNVGARHQNFYMTVIWILQIVSYINSTFNIFVYFKMGSRYRETFWLLFSRQRKLLKCKTAPSVTVPGRT